MCGGKSYGDTPLFDAAEGTVVRSPLQSARGWWAGAPTANFDSATNSFYLVYRYRQPRELGRGVECRIAASDNGITFNDIWALPKTSFDALSIERCALTRSPSGGWILYVSYVNPQDNRWCVALLEADEPDRFDAALMRPLFDAAGTGTEGVKDPNVFQIGPMYYMLVSYAVPLDGLQQEMRDQQHRTGDIYNTGLTLSRSAAAVSNNGIDFRWIGDVSPVAGSRVIVPRVDKSIVEPKREWDDYCRRVSTITPLSSGGFLALYDGSASVNENYEEKTGIAISYDLRNYVSLSPSAPHLEVSEGTGSLRYIDILSVGHELFYYYEAARTDGSHELRVNVVEQP